MRVIYSNTENTAGDDRISQSIISTTEREGAIIESSGRGKIWSRPFQRLICRALETSPLWTKSAVKFVCPPGRFATDVTVHIRCARDDHVTAVPFHFSTPTCGSRPRADHRYLPRRFLLNALDEIPDTKTATTLVVRRLVWTTRTGHGLTAVTQRLHD